MSRSVDFEVILQYAAETNRLIHHYDNLLCNKFANATIE